MVPEISRNSLPIPSRKHVGLTTYDAKDPDTAFPTIEPTLPPAGAPNVLIVLLDDVGFGASSAFGGLIDTPTADRLAAGGLKFNRFHTTALCAPTRQALLDRAQPPLGRHGWDHRGRHRGARLQLRSPGHRRPPGRHPAHERLLDGPVRQVPRGAGLADQSDGPVHPVADRQRFRLLLRVHRRRDEPVLPRYLRGDHTRRARHHPGRGLPLHRGHDRQGHRLGPPAAVAHGRPTLLHVLRPGRDPCAAPRPGGVVREVQGPLRRRLGRGAGGDLHPPEGAGRHPRRRRAHHPSGADPRLRGHARGAQARPGPTDGDLRRLPRAHRPPRRPAHRRPGGHGRPRGHARLLHHRRQRGLGRGPDQRHLQRAPEPQRCRRPRDRRVHGLPHRRLRRARRVQPLRRRLGPRHVHSVPVDQAGRVPLGWHPQRDDRALAQRHPGQGRDP